MKELKEHRNILVAMTLINLFCVGSPFLVQFESRQIYT